MRRALKRTFRPFGKASSFQRNGLDTFYIHLKEPHRQYAPGEKLRGSVILVLDRDQKIQNVKCTFEGHIIIKNPLVKGKTSKSMLFNDEIVLYTDEEDEVLKRGEHTFTFEFLLPDRGLYTAIEFERGSIGYLLAATCHKPGPTPVMVSQKSVGVVCPIDVATLPQPSPSILTVEVRKKRQSWGTISCCLELPHRGYLRGENVPVRVSVRHIKHMKSLSGVVVTLSRISRVTAEGLGPQTYRKDIAQTVSPLYTDPATMSASISTSIRIPPDTFPTTKGHKAVSFRYCIEAMIDLSGTIKTRQPAHHAVFIDTEKLVPKRGIVNLWTDLIIGTERTATPQPQRHNTSPQQQQQRTYSSSTITSTESPRHQHTVSMSIHSDSMGSLEQSIPSYEQTAHASSESHDEKTRLRQMEEALLPSAPPISQPLPQPSAPESSHNNNDDNLASSSRTETDKLEEERQRLANLASMPEVEGEDVPTYEPHAPPAFVMNGEAPPLPPPEDPSPSTPPLHPTIDSYNDDDDDIYSPSAPPMPPPQPSNATNDNQ
ncbi:hypothetical protein TRICI_003353 [Trichomonascus ciferrii]|uniref:pH-response regulator protein palF/RIM8 n=1 Tax=Trichomonascus ciferrii TaxID=44093 RepID=A0A642V3B8_9ASCO|nr:hypothetical protein TRICI_003353 [Trichomonascus ciferrii]